MNRISIEIGKQFQNLIQNMSGIKKRKIGETTICVNTDKQQRVRAAAISENPGNTSRANSIN